MEEAVVLAITVVCLAWLFFGPDFDERCAKCDSIFTRTTRRSTGPDYSRPDITHYAVKRRCLNCGDVSVGDSQTWSS